MKHNIKVGGAAIINNSGVCAGFCGTVYRDKAHREYIDRKEKELGREFTLTELTAADQEWYDILNKMKTSDGNESV